ncbi:T9SS type A sorting domain-containing protein [Hymenobacter negativus]|uniref:T9SS type A sorting domain-containing protein n=1 Tax=Hymenobacter negativus TaxID=2795026 RepID=A0ABS3QJC8_9BACT|nr:T9SS type A sorting domain-containing protein [Hymenobacter negativus]MBO2010884.1 T9SS type A sorting domain-containing protein [Hymenobacter negativus]
MKTKAYYKPSPAAALRFLVPALLGLGLILQPSQSNGQAANPCNLLPNPDFELQNVSQMSGAPDNVQSPTATHDEVTSWKFSGFAGGTNGHPIYYATNAPTGSLTNPFTNNPAVNFSGPDAYIGDSFTPYQYNSNPAVHNGAISIISILQASSSPLYREDNISPTTTLTLSPGTYYASFQAYRAAGNGSTRLGMKLANPEAFPNPMQSSVPLQNAAWTRVSGQVNVPAVSSANTNQWTVTIGNFAGGGSGSSTPVRVRYHIDEVELYKIPTAGPAAACSGSSVMIGEGCHIPGATYEWRRNGSPNVISTSTASPITYVDITDTYTLKVTLPDQTTFSSSVAVTGCNPQPAIIGNESACAGVSPTFTANSSNVTWSASPASFFATTSGSGSTFTPGLATGASGQGTITATFYSLLGSPTVTKTVTTVSVANPGPITGSNNTVNGRLTATIQPVPGAVSYNWFFDGPVTTGVTPGESPNSNIHGTTLTLYTARGDCGSIYSVSVQAVFAGGCVSPIVDGPNFRNIGCANREANTPGAAYPNPASESLAMPQGASNATLLNSQGKVVAQPDATGTLNVQHLPAGLYNLRMEQDGKMVNQHIEVKH